MCGIAGIVSCQMPVDSSLLRRMGNALQHRGPDGDSLWINDTKNAGFSHRRLAIVDLSNASAQPLHYLHYTIVYNGEIYNYKELRSQLQTHGYHFASQGDTEIIPAAFDLWGIKCLLRFDGMFAFALYNHQTKTTLLARDRFGEKPLYYALVKQQQSSSTGAGILFASEMKALWAAGVEKTINNEMLLAYLSLGFVQNPVNKQATFYENISLLPPAHFIEIDANANILPPQQWYNAAERCRVQTKPVKEKQAVEQFAHLLQQSVHRRLRSDVPVGISLSGGLDSSSVAATIAHCLQQEKNAMFSASAFTATFPGFEKDEAAYAKQVADAFQLQQFIISPSANDAEQCWKQMMYHQEEPVQSASALTQFLVYKLAKENHVKVLLDGQGADEVMAGYKKYSHWYLQQLLRSKPWTYLQEKSRLQQNELLEQWSVKNYVAAFFPKAAAAQLSARAKKQLRHHSFIANDFYHEFANEAIAEKPVVHALEDLLFYNTFQFGLEELLRYADRNSMAHSRELRLPFLNHELVEFVFSLPAHFKINKGFTKWILRTAMSGSLPASVVWRKNKIGYEPPQQQWMQQDFFKEMILQSKQQLVHTGVLDVSVLHKKFETKTAHAPDNYEWRFINAAALFNNS